MSYNLKPENAAFKPNQDLPQHLDHKPVFAMPYQAFDGIHAKGKTDVRYVSIGLAQYDHDHVSIKTMRHTGEKWTRQAEELPLHRPIDMTMFLAKVLFDSNNGNVTIPIETLQDQTSEMEITQEKDRTFGEIERFHRFLGKHDDVLKSRFNALFDVLSDLKKREKF